MSRDAARADGNPRAMYSVTPSGHTRFDHTGIERRRDGRLHRRPPVRASRSDTPTNRSINQPEPESPVLRLVRRVADHAEAISINPHGNGNQATASFADLPPDDEADLLVEWLHRMVEGWEGRRPTRCGALRAVVQRGGY